jgi:hypothetical protein
MKNGLFWRTFVLLAFLIAASMAAWVASFRIVERTPRGEQLAAQVVSIVTITRAALLRCVVNCCLIWRAHRAYVSTRVKRTMTPNPCPTPS